MDNYQQISTTDLIEMITNNQGVLLDVRSIDAYNGWKIHDEPRGGHIKGAKCLPAKWAKYIDWLEIVKSKGLKPLDNIFLYGYDMDESMKVAAMFASAGFQNIGIYNHFLDEWSPNNNLPMEHLPRYRNLVPAWWVHDLIQGKQPEGLEQQNTVICHAHYRNRDAYLSGHIPGAIEMDTLALESPETWNRRSPEELRRALLDHGITTDTTVVLYGKYMSPNNNDPFPGSAAGHIGAIRCAFIMMYAGIKDVRVLNGGFQSWKDAGFDVSKEDVPKNPASVFGTNIPAQPRLAVDVPEAKELLAASNGELVCVRSWAEYIGEVSGYNYIEKKGRIPGAVFADCGTDAYHMENYRNLDHTTLEFHEIEKAWLKAGLSPDKRLAFYCGTGWRGSEAFYNAWLMGWLNVAVFDGGWFEWSNDPANPYETGVPAEKVAQA
jgi:molybdopterin synthase sulfurtransferase